MSASLTARVDRVLREHFPGHERGIGEVIVREAERTNVRVSWLLALVETESSFRNVFGHDRLPGAARRGPRQADGTRSDEAMGGKRAGGIPESWVRVTRARYAFYKLRRGRWGAQGVGPCQLTWPGYQDLADRRGGCWRFAVNIAVGAEVIAGLVKQYGGWMAALATYNAGSPSSAAGQDYARRVQARRQLWVRRLDALR